MVSRQAAKQIGRLPVAVRKSLITLMREIETSGPVRGNWPNYGLLRKAVITVTLKKGVRLMWLFGKWLDKAIKVVEVIYAGTHERAPY